MVIDRDKVRKCAALGVRLLCLFVMLTLWEQPGTTAWSKVEGGTVQISARQGDAKFAISGKTSGQVLDGARWSRLQFHHASSNEALAPRAQAPWLPATEHVRWESGPAGFPQPAPIRAHARDPPSTAV